MLRPSKYVGKQFNKKKIIIIKLSNIKCRLLDLKIFLKQLNDCSTSTYIGRFKHI
jgi:hypothetical protein